MATPSEVSGELIGTSREGRPIEAFRYGSGSKNISLIAGNHADEPVGPLLLRKLVTFLSHLSQDHYLLSKYNWWIVPHTNPDGESLNRAWYTDEDSETDLVRYLRYVVREAPGEDLEFGYPIQGAFPSLRPESEAVYTFWQEAKGSFDLHVSLHGMGSAYGAWFLIDEAWIGRTKDLRRECAERTRRLGFPLYDVDRFGEKGFRRIAEGFCTRPDAAQMRSYFLQQGDSATAEQFYPSSMESIRSLGGDCLTLVSEMPLFLFPKRVRTLTWPDPYLNEWKEQFQSWKTQIMIEKTTMEQVRKEAMARGLKAMPWEAQLRLQWQLICSGMRALEGR